MKDKGKVQVALKLPNTGESLPSGYNMITDLILFGLKMNLTKKARLLARGHLVDPPQGITYSSVVSIY